MPALPEHTVISVVSMHRDPLVFLTVSHSCLPCRSLVNIFGVHQPDYLCKRDLMLSCFLGVEQVGDRYAEK